MVIKYVGNRQTNEYIGSRQFKARFAEITCTEKEQDRLFRIADYLREQGWDVDDGIECWVSIKVTDKREFDHVMEDYKEAKKMIKK